MQIRIKYEKGHPSVVIIKEPEDRFIDMDEAVEACVNELYKVADILNDKPKSFTASTDWDDILFKANITTIRTGIFNEDIEGDE